MAISDTITSIEDNLRADYEGLENIYGEITGINKNILNIRTILDTIYNDMPKVTGEGTEVTLTPTRKGRLALIPKGNSTQESTTGKNRLPYTDNFSSTVNGTTLTGEKGIYQISGTNGSAAMFNVNLLENYTIQEGDYLHLGNNATTSNMTFGIATSNTTIIAAPVVSAINRVIDLSNFVGQTAAKLNVYHNANYDGTPITFKAMICSSSTATDFEQYTGGIPAPNPSYPFPIKNVTGNNNVLAEGKNIIPLNEADFTITYRSQNVEIKNQIIKISGSASEIYSISVGDSGLVSATDNSRITFEVKAGTYKYTQFSSGTATNTNVRLKDENTNTMYSTDSTITLTETHTFSINIFIGDTSNKNATITIQLEKGSTATSYMPYVTPQTKPLNLGNIELNKIGNSKNLIFKAENGNAYYDSLTAEQKALLTYGARYYHEEIGKKILDDTENWTQNVQNEAFVISDLSPSYMVTSEYNILSNYYLGVKNITEYSQLSNNQIALLNSSTNNRLIIRDNRFTGMTAFKQWIHDNNVTIYYALATPQDIEITDTSLIEQLEEIDKMKSYEGTTIITSTYDSNNAQMILSASALKGE